MSENIENVIERGVILNANKIFTIPELTLEPSEPTSAGQLTLEEMEYRFIHDTLEKTHWKIYGNDGAAQLLGLHHSTLYSRMKKLGIKNPNKN